MADILIQIDWKGFLLGGETWSFLMETCIRSFFMFLVILFSLRLLGKRGIKQLSVFELGVIIGLGSAAGDPMFYRDVGILPGMMVFMVVMSMYKLVTYLINHSDHFERFVEGKPTYIISEGCFLYQNFKKEPIARDELFMQLRLKNVSQLGQVETAILETSGEVSVFFYPDEKVKKGLPILPHYFDKKGKTISREQEYSCTYCGQTQKLQPGTEVNCSGCGKCEWVPALDNKRIK